MKTFLSKNRKFNMFPIKNALYMLQVVVISISIPILCVVDLSHKDKTTEPVEISVDHPQPPAATINI